MIIPPKHETHSRRPTQPYELLAHIDTLYIRTDIHTIGIYNYIIHTYILHNIYIMHTYVYIYILGYSESGNNSIKAYMPGSTENVSVFYNLFSYFLLFIFVKVVVY